MLHISLVGFSNGISVHYFRIKTLLYFYRQMTNQLILEVDPATLPQIGQRFILNV